MKSLSKTKAVLSINKNGMLLVYPINNNKEPNSLWREFFPKQKMKWDWSDESHNHVALMWYLMKDLSSHKQVVYSKWYRDRATFISREVFVFLLWFLKTTEIQKQYIPRAARDILDCLENNSPLSTKDLKAETGMKGKSFEAEYQRAMKYLFRQGWIVACGEKDDGAFPSLLVGATSLVYEDLWRQARMLNTKLASEFIERNDFKKTLFYKFAEKIKSSIKCQQTLIKS